MENKTMIKLHHKAEKQKKLLGRQKRFLKRKRKLVKIKNKSKTITETSSFISSNYVSDDENFLGDSEESEDDGHLTTNKHSKVTNVQLCLTTRLSLAKDQLENNKKGQLVCLTCLKPFSNIQNLR